MLVRADVCVWVPPAATLSSSLIDLNSWRLVDGHGVACQLLGPTPKSLGLWLRGVEWYGLQCGVTVGVAACVGAGMRSPNPQNPSLNVHCCKVEMGGCTGADLV